MKTKLAGGDWCETFDGIGQAVSLHPIPIEEFTSEGDADGKALGETGYTLVKYKLFCNFSGKPRKRQYWHYTNERFCRPLDKAMQKTVNKLIKDDPGHYAKFNSLPIKPVNHVFSFEVYTKSAEVCANAVEQFNASGPPFTYPELVNSLAENGCSIAMHVAEDALEQLLLSFNNRDLAVKNDRMLFVNIVATVPLS